MATTLSPLSGRASNPRLRPNTNISGDPSWGKAPNLKLLLIKPRAAAQEAVSTEEGAEGRSQHVGRPR